MKARMILIAGALVSATAACSGPTTLVAGGEGLDLASIPTEVQSDYRVFAHRCSKCHSLSRALNSGIDDDVFWAHYVARMRRQPASGISLEDEVIILRFLHYYSEEQKRSKTGGATGDSRGAPGRGDPPSRLAALPSTSEGGR